MVFIASTESPYWPLDTLASYTIGRWNRTLQPTNAHGSSVVHDWRCSPLKLNSAFSPVGPRRARIRQTWIDDTPNSPKMVRSSAGDTAALRARAAPARRGSGSAGAEGARPPAAGGPRRGAARTRSLERRPGPGGPAARPVRAHRVVRTHTAARRWPQPAAGPTAARATRPVVACRARPGNAGDGASRRQLARASHSRPTPRRATKTGAHTPPCTWKRKCAPKPCTRKKLTKSPRYLFFDLGVRRAAAEEGRHVRASVRS